MTGARRGKTRPGRLRRLDRYLLHGHPEVVDALRMRPLAVDVGIGAVPHTTLELAQHLAPRVPALRVLGTDIDADRVAAARRTERVRFAVADLVPPGLTPGLVRAFNLLRGFSLQAAEVALSRLRQSLAPGGVLLEGTSDKRGRVLVAAMHRRDEAGSVSLDRVVFHLDVALGFAPRMLRVRIPKTLRHQRRLDPFLEAWTASWAATRPARAATTEARRAWFIATAQHLAPRWPIAQNPWGWRHGYVEVRMED